MTRFNFGPNDTHTQRWGRFKAFDLSHLDAAKVTYAFEDGSRYDAYVTYSHHCFAKSVAGYNDYDDYWYPHPKDPRHFHPERYELSKSLPAVIQALPNLFTFFGGGDNFCAAKMTTTAGQEVNYLVVFTLFKSIKKIRLHVSSAYVKDDVGRVRKVRFEKAIKAVYAGRKLQRPK